jgi:hypothetical protein
MRQRSMSRIAAILACAGCFGPMQHVSAQEAGAPPRHEQSARAPGSGERLVAAVEPMDPVMQAILLAMAARVLREAAASPDPLEALGRTLERMAASAAADPRTLETIEALSAQVLKEAPPELREALVGFILGALDHARRERQAPRPAAP